MATAQLPDKTKRACDQCSYRKLKCDGNQPCHRCIRMDFGCSYQRHHQRKMVSGKRVQFLRGREETLDSDGGGGGGVGGGGGEMEIQLHSRSQEEIQIGLPTMNGQQQQQQQVSSGIEDLDVHSHSDGRNPFDTESPRPQSPWFAGAGPMVLEGPGDHGAMGSRQSAPSTSTVTSQGQVRPGLHRGYSSEHRARQEGSQHSLSHAHSHSHSHSHDHSHDNDTPLLDPTIYALGIKDEDLLRWADIFFDRLYFTLPLVDRASLYRDLLLRRHSKDPDFMAMVLSLCAVALVEPVYMEENTSLPSREDMARQLLSRAGSLRSHVDFGQSPSIEGALAGFFMFAALFALSLHNSAWLRLKEAIEYGRLLGLHKPESYHRLGAEQRNQRLRAFVILCVSERGYALQRNHQISFTGHPTQVVQEVYRLLRHEGAPSPSGIIIHDRRDATAMLGLVRLMKIFDSVDEHVIPCFNRQCRPYEGACTTLTAAMVRKIHEDIERGMVDTPVADPVEDILCGQFSPSQPSPSSSSSCGGPGPGPQAGARRRMLEPSQWADVFMLQQWVYIRLWVSCLTHGLLDPDSESAFMRPTYPFSVAQKALDECQSLGQTVLEMHGLGMIERIYDIAMGIIIAMQHLDMSCHNTSSNSTPTEEALLLQRHFELLTKLRGGKHPFLKALNKALETV